MLDFNDAGPQLGVGAQTKYYDLVELERRLRRDAARWIPPLFPLARRSGDELRCANIRGDKPRKTGSFVVHVGGKYAGSYRDWSTEESGGPLNLLGAKTRLTGRALFDHAAGIVGLTPDQMSKPHRSLVDVHHDGHHRGVPEAQESLDHAAHQQELAEAARLGTALQVEAIQKCCAAPAGTLLETYLRSRKIRTIGTDLAYTENLTHYESRYSWPAMVATIRFPDGKPTGGIHQTWLDRDGTRKAPVENQKKMFGPIKGGAVHLAPMTEEGVLGIGEGIETSLSAMQIYGVPCWACLSDGGINRFGKNGFPAGLRTLFIFADSGKAGETAAHHCADRARAHGIAVAVVLPVGGDDFNDDLIAGHAPRPLPTPVLDAIEPFYPDVSLPVEAATAQLITSVNGFFKRALAWVGGGR